MKKPELLALAIAIGLAALAIVAALPQTQESIFAPPGHLNVSPALRKWIEASPCFGKCQ